MSSLFIARLRHILLGPGKHRRRQHRVSVIVTPDQFMLMFRDQNYRWRRSHVRQHRRQANGL